MDIDAFKKEVLVRLGVSTTIAYYTDTILVDWFIMAHKWAATYKKWPITEGKETTTYSSSQEEYDYPEDWRPDSIRLLQVGGKRHQKLNFEDYQMFRENKPDSKDRVYTDYRDIYFINPNTDASGTTTVWGQFTPYIDKTDETAKTVFDGDMSDADEAIILRMLSYAMQREKKSRESINFLERGKALLDNIWTRIRDEQFGYHGKDRGMFKDFNIFTGGYDDDINENQFY